MNRSSAPGTRRHAALATARGADPVPRRSRHGRRGRVPRRGDQAPAVVRVYRLPRVVQGLAQVRSRRSRAQLRPEQVHHLLARKSMARRQREQLDQSSCPASPPRRCRNDVLSDRDAKTAEQLDPEYGRLHHTDTILTASPWTGLLSRAADESPGRATEVLCRPFRHVRGHIQNRRPAADALYESAGLASSVADAGDEGASDSGLELCGISLHARR